MRRYADALMERNGGPDVILRLRDSLDRRTRRCAFSRCLDGGLLTVDDLLIVAQDRRDQFMRHTAANALEHEQQPDEAALRTLLRGR